MRAMTAVRRLRRRLAATCVLVFALGLVGLAGSAPAGAAEPGFSYGHRNAQGIAFGSGGRLYAVEHGPKSDDELNLIRPGGNYGWPHVLGARDDRAYTYASWSASRIVPCSALTYSDYVIPLWVPQARETQWSHPDFTPPIRTFFTVPSGFRFLDSKCAQGTDFVCWPTIAPSSVDIYTATHNGVPGWANSLLITTLKHGTVYRLKLDDAQQPTGELIPYWTTVNRYRDIAIHPNRRTFYVATDQRGLVRDRAGRPARTSENPGAIFEFRYRPGRRHAGRGAGRYIRRVRRAILRPPHGWSVATTSAPDGYERCDGFTSAPERVPVACARMIASS